jgi:NAD(P)-dependent dehydrogenase (short-subunit alcohol dehydrogenase family)
MQYGTMSAASATLRGHTVLVTGSTDGLGRVVAERLGATGANVLLHGRNLTRGEQVRRAVQVAGGAPTFYQADFASLAEVHRLAEAIRQNHDRLKLLINNAGLGFGPRGQARETSSDGHELRFAVNYLAPVLLTQLLLPLLEADVPARIVNVASAGQQQIDFNDPMLTRGYTGQRAYRQSKLAMIMWTLDLAEELTKRGVTVNALHPATFMDTHMVHESGISPASTVEEGADAVMHLALSRDLEGWTGLYFNGLERARPDPQAFDREARRQLAELTVQLIGAASARVA